MGKDGVEGKLEPKTSKVGITYTGSNRVFSTLVMRGFFLNKLEVNILDKKEIETELKETREKMAGVLTAISVVSKDLAKKLVELERRNCET
ncbi:MAG: hypothetical protein P4L59_18845 [Desulfosporosinus sp.]|nr:hypothetical protein [Desulfosporosinus sp.]